MIQKKAGLKVFWGYMLTSVTGKLVFGNVAHSRILGFEDESGTQR
jgi:hypothetical protein